MKKIKKINRKISIKREKKVKEMIITKKRLLETKGTRLLKRKRIKIRMTKIKK